MEYYEEDTEEKDWDEDLDSDGIDSAERGVIDGYERTTEEDDAGKKRVKRRREEEVENFDADEGEIDEEDEF